MNETIVPIFYDLKNSNQTSQTNQTSSDLQQSSNELRQFNEPIDMPHLLGNVSSQRME